jgi:hypothetical protein
MGLFVSALQPLCGYVGVNLRRHKVRVAQEFLDAPQVGAAIEQMSGVTVPQFVGCEMGIKAGESQVLF